MERRATSLQQQRAELPVIADRIALLSKNC